MFEGIPAYVIVLGVLEVILVPLLIRVSGKLAKIVDHVKSCAESMENANASLVKILDEQSEARVRDKDFEGRLKSLNDKVDKIISN